MKKARFPLKPFVLLFIFLLYGVLQVKQAIDGLSQNKPGKNLIIKEKFISCKDPREAIKKDQEAVDSRAARKPVSHAGSFEKPGPEFFFYDWSVFSLLIIS